MYRMLRLGLAMGLTRAADLGRTIGPEVLILIRLNPRKERGPTMFAALRDCARHYFLPPRRGRDKTFAHSG